MGKNTHTFRRDPHRRLEVRTTLDSEVFTIEELPSQVPETMEGHSLYITIMASLY